MDVLEQITYSNTCCVIVTYNPDNSFLENLQIISSLFCNVFVVDNCSKKVNELILSVNQKFHNVELILEKNNWGIAKALNIGIKRALQHNPKWIFTFDQDSIPSDRFIEKYNIALSQLSTSNVGLLSCGFTSNVNTSIDERIEVKSKYTLITSGCLHNPKIFSEIGYYDESLFIDCVDFDFCLRVAKAGFGTYRIRQPLLFHHLGNPIYKKMLFWNVPSTNHNLIRRYYMSRNHFIISKKYFTDFPFYILKKNLFFILTLFQILYVESNRREKIFIMLKGFKDSFLFHK